MDVTITVPFWSDGYTDEQLPDGDGGVLRRPAPGDQEPFPGAAVLYRRLEAAWRAEFSAVLAAALGESAGRLGWPESVTFTVDADAGEYHGPVTADVSLDAADDLATLAAAHGIDLAELTGDDDPDLRAADVRAMLADELAARYAARAADLVTDELIWPAGQRAERRAAALAADFRRT